MTPIRVLIADDQALVRAGFAKLLESEPGIEVVGEAGNGREATEAAFLHRPDVVLMDIRMPVLDGLEATRIVVGRHPAIRIVILTTFDLDEYVFEALKAGASGFLLKDSPPDELLAAIRVVAGGEALLAPKITSRLIAEFARRPVPSSGAHPEMNELSSREREVMTMVARGLSNMEIAEKLFVSESTIKTHVGSLLRKLGLRDRVEVVVLAYESGLVQPGN